VNVLIAETKSKIFFSAYRCDIFEYFPIATIITIFKITTTNILKSWELKGLYEVLYNLHIISVDH